MDEKLYTTYSVGDGLTLFEIDRKKIKNTEYVLLLQKQEPNAILVGFFDDDKLEIVKNRVIRSELLKIFTENKKELYKKIRPFFIALKENN